MKSSYTIAIIGPAGSGIRQLAIARKTLFLAAALLVLTALAMAAGARDYLHLKKQVSRLHAMDARLQDQSRLITLQRQQVQTFAEDINTLKDRLVEISDFEKKIRVIANIGTDAESPGLFGMGGATPEDLEPRLPLAEAHGALMRDMHEQVLQLGSATARQSARFDDLLSHLENQIDLLAATPSIRPAKGWPSSRFGQRTSPFTGRPEFHRALDIANEVGTPIQATADGVVTYAGNKWLLGKTLVVDHGHGMLTRYAHCSDLLKKRGEAVKRGDVIARMGNTGRSTGPHLHYEVRLNGVPVNPEKYILN